MLVDDRRRLDAILRNDLASFAKLAFSIVAPGERLGWSWHHDAICHHLDMVLTGKVTRLLIEVPPRSLKSIICSVAFPAFCLGRNPGSKIITASYSNDLAAKHANDCRVLIGHPRYRALFSSTVLAKNTEADFVTTKRGFRYSTSPGGTLTGRGGDMLILDDIINPREASSEVKREAARNWYAHTAYSRLNDKRSGAIIVVMQRLHADDLAGYLREQGGFTILSLPARAEDPIVVPVGPGRYKRLGVGDFLQPEREGQQVLDDIRRTIGSYNFSAQYQQRPIPAEGELIKWTWFKRFKVPPDRYDRTIVQSWDIGITAGEDSDYSVCTTWMRVGKDHYLINLIRGRWEFPALKRLITDHARRNNANKVIIEDMVTGTALIQQIRSEKCFGMPSPTAYRPKGDKVSRMVGETPAIESGQVYLPEEAPWLDDLRKEIAQFPKGRNDDQIDSISQYLNWVREHSGPSIGFARFR